FGDRQRRAENPRDGYRSAPSHQGLLSHLQLHDRGDGRRKRRGLLPARRPRPGRSRSRGPGVCRRFSHRRTHSPGRIKREDSPAFRRGARGAGAPDGPERLRHQAGRALGMSKETVTAPQPELLLTALLRYGTWLASGVTGLGLAMSLAGVEGAHVVAA